MYNAQYKIHFKFNPTMQCILGKFEGWINVLDVYTDCRPIKKDDDVKFIYNSASQFKKLNKFIKGGK